MTTKSKEELLKLAEDEQKAFFDRFDALLSEAKLLGDLDEFLFKATPEIQRKANLLKEFAQREISYKLLENAPQLQPVNAPYVSPEAQQALIQNQADLAALNNN